MKKLYLALAVSLALAGCGDDRRAAQHQQPQYAAPAPQYAAPAPVIVQAPNNGVGDAVAGAAVGMMIGNAMANNNNRPMPPQQTVIHRTTNVYNTAPPVAQVAPPVAQVAAPVAQVAAPVVAPAAPVVAPAAPQKTVTQAFTLPPVAPKPVAQQTITFTQSAPKPVVQAAPKPVVQAAPKPVVQAAPARTTTSFNAGSFTRPK